MCISVDKDKKMRLFTNLALDSMEQFYYVIMWIYLCYIVYHSVSGIHFLKDPIRSR
jgi:hypothetical protein